MAEEGCHPQAPPPIFLSPPPSTPPPRSPKPSSFYSVFYFGHIVVSLRVGPHPFRSRPRYARGVAAVAVVVAVAATLDYEFNLR